MMSCTISQHVLETISALFHCASIAALICGGSFALIRWVRSEKERRARFLKSLLDEFYTGSDAVALFSLDVDYDKWKYSEKFHGDTSNCRVDRALTFVAYVCYLLSTGTIKDDEFKFFRYDFDRIMTSPDVQGYLYNLYHFSKKCGTGFSYHWLYKYGIERGFILKEDFENPNNPKFTKFLNY